MYVHLVQQSLELPQTPAEWALYRELSGVEEAAESLTDALKNAFNWLVKTEEATPSKAMAQFMLPVMNKYMKVGSLDSEPRDIAMVYLHKAQKLRMWAKEPV